MNLDRKDILAILKSCKKLGVSHIKLGDIEVDFNTNCASTEEIFKAPSKNDEVKIARIEEEVLSEEELERDIERLAASDIEDPERYEDLVLYGIVNQEGHY